MGKKTSWKMSLKMSPKTVIEWGLSKMYPVEVSSFLEDKPDHFVPSCVLARLLKDKEDFMRILGVCGR